VLPVETASLPVETKVDLRRWSGMPASPFKEDRRRSRRIDMACKEYIVALSMIVAASPVSAGQPDPTEAGAPAAPADARYCLWIEAVTGTRLETIRCETREGWAELEVDVDKEWAKEGVRVIS